MFETIFAEPLPPTIKDLLDKREEYEKLFPTTGSARWRVSRRPGLSFSAKDSASASFYRIYQFIILGQNIQMRNELEYFCCRHPDWAIESLPDPADHAEPSRYAALAAITHLMCDSFNRRIELGLPRDAPPIVEDWEELARRPKVLERVPSWADKVAPLPAILYIPNAEGHTIQEDDPEVCPPFKKLNIIISQPHVHFI